MTSDCYDKSEDAPGILRLTRSCLNAQAISSRIGLCRITAPSLLGGFKSVIALCGKAHYCSRWFDIESILRILK